MRLSVAVSDGNERMKSEAQRHSLRESEPTVAEKVAFLRRPDSYHLSAGQVSSVETHMSFVFLAGDRAYKLKKPIKLPYLDFSTVKKREAACRAELALNRRLAPSVYLDVVPLCVARGGLRIGGQEPAIDWLVVMRRLDGRLMLDAAIERRCLTAERVEALERTLGKFFRHAKPVLSAPGKCLAKWRDQIKANRIALLQPQLRMPVALVSELDRVQRRFLDGFASPLLERVRQGRVLDGHGDLRPEHIWLGEPLSVIDCLEFNAGFRAVDPFDELAYLSIECERLGDDRIGPRLTRTLMRMLGDAVPPELLAFYRCYRATLRANLSAAHLLDPNPRTPKKWRPLALQYLEIARREACALDRLLNKPTGRPFARRNGGAELPARTNRR